MSTKTPYLVSAPSDPQHFGTGTFAIYWGGKNCKFTLDGSSWQVLPPNNKMSRGGLQIYHNDTVNTILMKLEAGDSDIYEILWAYAELTTTSTAGNRSLNLEIKDVNSKRVWLSQSQATQPASTTEYYMFTNIKTHESAFPGLHHLTIPQGLQIGNDNDLIIEDGSGTDSNDDMKISVGYVRRSEFDYKSITVEATDFSISHTESNVAGSEQSVKIIQLK